MKGEGGEITINVLRDGEGHFELKIVGNHQTRFNRFDEITIALYARGLSVTDIQAQLQELYHVAISTSLISAVTDSVLGEVTVWQNRPLEALYPIVYLDCLVAKVHQDKRIMKKSVYLALGIDQEGQKELLGMWMSQNVGVKFWLNVLTELKNRELKDSIIACVDGLTGFPESIAEVYPRCKTQLCIVHMVGNSLKYVSWKHRKKIAMDLKNIYTAPTIG